MPGKGASGANFEERFNREARAPWRTILRAVTSKRAR